MFRISGLIFIALLFSVHTMQRQIQYSRLDKEVINSPLAVPYGEVASLIIVQDFIPGTATAWSSFTAQQVDGALGFIV